jgi:hypothetical protein
LLLQNIRAIFDDLRATPLSSATLISALHDFGDGHWSEWRGVNNERTPHKLTQGELARLTIKQIISRACFLGCSQACIGK